MTAPLTSAERAALREQIADKERVYPPPTWVPRVHVRTQSLRSLLDEVEDWKKKLANLVAETGIPEGGECAVCCAPFSWDGIKHDEGCEWWEAARAVLSEEPKEETK